MGVQHQRSTGVEAPPDSSYSAPPDMWCSGAPFESRLGRLFAQCQQQACRGVSQDQHRSQCRRIEMTFLCGGARAKLDRIGPRGVLVLVPRSIDVAPRGAHHSLTIHATAGTSLASARISMAARHFGAFLTQAATSVTHAIGQGRPLIERPKMQGIVSESFAALVRLWEARPHTPTARLPDIDGPSLCH